MEEKRTSIFSNALVWFGAGVSIAEILTGTLFASLGFSKGFLAILIGHIIGGVMMFAAGLIGGFERKSSMDTVKMSFGEIGGRFFAILNVIQLIGWTAIMIYDGAISANEILPFGLWSIVIGILILVWIMIGLTNLGKINLFAMSALFILTLIMAQVIFSKHGVKTPVSEAISFGGAVELAVAMPLSWLPLISDYTKEAEKPVGATAASVITYGVISIFMYTIGMGAAIFTGETDIAGIMLKAGFGIVGLLIIVFSTVTTAFLDVYSAGLSAQAISEKLDSKLISIIVTIVGILAAIFFKPANITNFLYFIGSVFAPMIAIQIADYFVLKNREVKKGIDYASAITWVIGFILYRLLMRIETPLGITIVDMILTLIIAIIINKILKERR